MTLAGEAMATRLYPRGQQGRPEDRGDGIRSIAARRITAQGSFRKCQDPFRPVGPRHPQDAGILPYMEGAYSRRINIQHRLVYQILRDTHTIKILRMWTHYE